MPWPWYGPAVVGKKNEGSAVTTEARIRAEGLGVTYPGANGPALEDVSITLAPGRVAGLVGDNGAG